MPVTKEKDLQASKCMQYQLVAILSDGRKVEHTLSSLSEVTEEIQTYSGQMASIKVFFNNTSLTAKPVSGSLNISKNRENELTVNITSSDSDIISAEVANFVKYLLTEKLLTETALQISPDQKMQHYQNSPLGFRLYVNGKESIGTDSLQTVTGTINEKIGLEKSTQIIFHNISIKTGPIGGALELDKTGVSIEPVKNENSEVAQLLGNLLKDEIIERLPFDKTYSATVQQNDPGDDIAPANSSQEVADLWQSKDYKYLLNATGPAGQKVSLPFESLAAIEIFSLAIDLTKPMSITFHKVPLQDKNIDGSLSINKDANNKPVINIPAQGAMKEIAQQIGQLLIEKLELNQKYSNTAKQDNVKNHSNDSPAIISSPMAKSTETSNIFSAKIDLTNTTQKANSTDTTKFSAKKIEITKIRSKIQQLKDFLYKKLTSQSTINLSDLDIDQPQPNNTVATPSSPQKAQVADNTPTSTANDLSEKQEPTRPSARK